MLEDTMASILPLGSKARGRILVKFVNAAGQEEAGIDDSTADSLSSLGEKIRNLTDHGLSEAASTRVLIYAGKLIKDGILKIPNRNNFRKPINRKNKSVSVSVSFFFRTG